MRIQLISDIHTEFHMDYGKSFIDSLDPNGVEVLVVAGDLGNVDTFPMAIRWLANKYSEVIFVWGNHECYDSSISEAGGIAWNMAEKHPNLHVLDNDVVVINGQRFIGTTMWFRDNPMNAVHAPKLNDFHLIRGFSEEVYNENAVAIEFLQENVREGDVVVTHHMPSHQLTPDRFKGSELNRFFVCDMEDLILYAKPRFWLYGHSHSSVGRRIGETYVVCNPLGYIRTNDLNQEFDEKMILEV